MQKQFLFIIFLGCTIFIKAQIQDRFFSPNPAPTTFSTIQNQAKNYFNALPDTARDGQNEAFERWENFWQNRVGSSNANENGTFLPAYKALYALLNSPVCATSANYPANWVELGPGITPQPLQTLGIVSAVAFDPIAPATTFYAGTTNSGLWKTTNGGR